MKTTKFAFYLNKFFTVYLPSSKGSSPATVDSYRYAFIQFVSFMEERGVLPDRIKIDDLTQQTVLDFLNWLQKRKGNSTATRNQRQAALNSFFRYLMHEFPDYLSEVQRILAIPIKKAPEKEISFLKTEGVRLLLEQVDLNKRNGLRDYAMLVLLYTTGIRVSELIHLRVKDVSLQTPATLLVHGKGQRDRYVPLFGNATKILGDYISQYQLDREHRFNDWLFKNHMNEQLQRQGVNYIINKYANLARSHHPEMIPTVLSPHKIRHTTAMELVDAGVDLIYIRDLLGHVSVKTTETYAKANSRKKREAIEEASRQITPQEPADWETDATLKDWLKNFNRRPLREEF